MEASISKAFRSIGLSIAPMVVPTLTHALKRSDSLSSLVLVDNLLFLALEGKTISSEMTAADLADRQCMDMEKKNNVYSAQDIFVATRVRAANSVHYELDYMVYHYDIFYEHGYVKVEEQKVQVFLQQISRQDNESWDDNETVAYLHWIKEAIRKGTLEALKLPQKDEILRTE